MTAASLHYLLLEKGCLDTHDLYLDELQLALAWADGNKEKRDRERAAKAAEKKVANERAKLSPGGFYGVAAAQRPGANAPPSPGLLGAFPGVAAKLAGKG